MIIDHQPVTLDLVLDQGDSYYKEFTLTHSGVSMNLTGLSIFTDVRRYANTNKVYPLTAQIVNSVTGVISLSLTPQQSMLFKNDRYVYQVKLSDGNDIVKVIQGHILVNNGASSVFSKSAITGNEISSFTGTV
jgi:hypothetical protein